MSLSYHARSFLTVSLPVLILVSPIRAADWSERRVIDVSELSGLLLLVAAAAPATPLIENPEHAPRRREVVLREQWRVGADEDDPLMGPVGGAVADDAGNVYLLDTQKQEVLKFAADGRYLGLVARKGEGPGEIELVFSLELLDGNRLGLIKIFPPEVIVVGLDGTPQPSLRPEAPDLGGGESRASLHVLASRDGFQMVAGRRSRYDGQAQHHTSYVASLAASGKPRHCYGTHERSLDFSRAITMDELALWSPWQQWALGRGGEVYFAPARDRWRIEVRDQDGTLLRTITRPGSPHRRTAAEKEEAKNGYSFMSSRELPPISYRIADTDPVIAGLHFDGRELQVQAPRRDGASPGVRAFDVLDAEGRLLESRTVRVPGVGPDDGLLPLDDGRVVCVKNLEAAQAASTAGMQVQVGDKRQTASDDAGGDLEIILFAPEGWKPGLPRS
ncbi:hypothetical protein FJ250_11115 [bacterium]|nr:hypothetical protein [bacterium]